MGKLFGTDGVRGIANTELTVDLAISIAKAAATVLAKVDSNGANQPLVLIGKDTRISSDMLEAALVSGFTSLGVKVKVLGVVPTPAVAYLVKQTNASCGVMISASHNPYEYNGIKLFSGDGYKLDDALEEEIERLIELNEYNSADSHNLGSVSYDSSLVEDYITHLIGTINIDISGMRVAIDCANGSASRTAQKLFKKLKVDAQILCASPTGININEHCGSTHMEEFCHYVKHGHFDIGFAFDGDADRCLAVDQEGNVIDGDMMLAVLAKHMSEAKTLYKDTTVVTVLTNLGFFEFSDKHNLNTEITKVGDRYILENMVQNGYNLGGENSGHIIMKDYASTGDGQLAAIQLLSIMRSRQCSIGELLSVINIYPQVMVNIKVENNKKALIETDEAILSAVKQAEASLGDTGRILLRASGTEPLVRVMLEGQSEEMINKIASEVSDIVRSVLCV